MSRRVVVVLIGAAVLFLASCALMNTEPVASFEVSGDVQFVGQAYQTKVGAKIQFNASSSFDSDGTIDFYNWDFGDGVKEEENSPLISHAFTQEGTYWVTLQVVDNCGSPSCTDCMRVKFVVAKPVVPPPPPPPPCQPPCPPPPCTPPCPPPPPPPPDPVCVDPVITELKVDGQQLSSSVVPEKELYDIVSISVRANDSDSCLPCSGPAKQNGITSIQVTVRKQGGSIADTRTFDASSGSFTISACEIGLWTIEVVAYDDDCSQRTVTRSGNFRVVDSTPPPPPPPDPCDTNPFISATLVTGQMTLGTVLSVQIIAYQPPDHTSGYHPGDMARIQVTMESPSGVFLGFDTRTGIQVSVLSFRGVFLGFNERTGTLPAIPSNGVIQITLNEPGTWILRGICWNLCQQCALTDEFFYSIEVE